MGTKSIGGPLRNWIRSRTASLVTGPPMLLRPCPKGHLTSRSSSCPGTAPWRPAARSPPSTWAHIRTWAAAKWSGRRKVSGRAEQALADVATGGGDLAQLVEELQDGQVRPGTLAGDRADPSGPECHRQHEYACDQVIGGLLEGGSLPVGQLPEKQADPSRDLADLKVGRGLHASRKPQHPAAVQRRGPTRITRPG